MGNGEPRPDLYVETAAGLLAYDLSLDTIVRLLDALFDLPVPDTIRLDAPHEPSARERVAAAGAVHGRAGAGRQTSMAHESYGARRT